MPMAARLRNGGANLGVYGCVGAGGLGGLCSLRSPASPPKAKGRYGCLVVGGCLVGGRVFAECLALASFSWVLGVVPPLVLCGSLRPSCSVPPANTSPARPMIESLLRQSQDLGGDFPERVVQIARGLGENVHTCLFT